MQPPDLYAIIMAGGSGTRFWPASRRTRPKQFLSIAGGEPLLCETWRRLEGLVPAERTLVVTVASQAGEVRRLLPALPPENVLAEPEPRNTAACLALAAREIERRDPSSVQVVLPADHVIRPVPAFQRSVQAAVEEARARSTLVVFGIRPSHPATGFGYVEAGELCAEVRQTPVYRVRRFVEKPSLARAQEFLFQGSFFWNAGIFVWQTQAICSALETFTPALRAALAGARSPAELAQAYARLEPVSIDVAVLEHAPNVRMVPVDYFWSDVGSWEALSTVLEQDAAGNVHSGAARAVFQDARGCIAHAEGDQLVAVLGLDNVVVVHSAGATLVCSRERAQHVRALVQRLEAEAPELL
jgi:mannose-1-phosphate guanylyltransferase